MSSTAKSEVTVDCGIRNPILALFDQREPEVQYSILELALRWFLTAGFLYVPPLIYYWLIDQPLIAASSELEIPYLASITIPVRTLLATPLLIVHLLQERRLFGQIVHDYFAVSPPASGFDSEAVNDHYLKWNPVLFGLSLVVAAIITFKGVDAYVDGTITSYTYGTSNPGYILNPMGYWTVILDVGGFWFFTVFAGLRGIGHFWFFRKLVGQRPAEINPLHPDGLGGLAMISDVIKLVRPVVLVVGVVLTTGMVSEVVIKDGSIAAGSNLAIIVSFVAFCIVMFLLPIAPFNGMMNKAKNERLAALGKQFRDLDISLVTAQGRLSRLRHRVENLQWLHRKASSMPVWPYDVKTVVSFVKFVFAPIIGVLLTALAQWAMTISP